MVSSLPSEPPAPGARTSALRLTGRDALSLLHRISSQALLDLRPGEARATLFCDFRGRLLHRALVYLGRDGAVWLLRDDAPGQELAAFLDRHVFRDDVKIEDRSAELPVTRIAGAVGGVAENDGVPRSIDLGDETWRVGSPAPAWDEARRIASGLPTHGHEIADEFNPFEVGLGADVHLDKGCYTGQEALQRLITYRSVRRGPARVRGEGPTPASPADLTWRGERAGRLTSAAPDPDHPGGWIGLAVLKLDCLESGEVPELEGGPLRGPPERLTSPQPLGRS
jgi:folate-binding protein YgfZ